MISKIPLKEAIYVAGVILAAGIQWGILTSKLSAQETKIAETASVKEAVPVILSRLSNIETDVRDIKRALLRPR